MSSQQQIEPGNKRQHPVCEELGSLGMRLKASTTAKRVAAKILGTAVWVEEIIATGLRPNRRKPSPLVLRPNQRKSSQ
jgi:hypothetical protein